MKLSEEQTYKLLLKVFGKMFIFPTDVAVASEHLALMRETIDGDSIIIELEEKKYLVQYYDSNDKILQIIKHCVQ